MTDQNKELNPDESIVVENQELPPDYSTLSDQKQSIEPIVVEPMSEISRDEIIGESDVSNKEQSNSNIDIQSPFGSGIDGESKVLKIGKTTLDLDDLMSQFKGIFSSPNPFALYTRLSGIKYKLSGFINNITTEIVDGFGNESLSSIYSLYYESEYDKILLNHMEDYLYESKYFDLRFYFDAITTFQKDKQILAKGLLKFYKNDSEDNIRSFLKTYNANGSTFNKIKDLYNQLGINDVKIEPRYLDENKVNDFLEKVYFELGEQKRQLFLINFNLHLDNINFKDVYDVFRTITGFYIDKESSWCKRAWAYIDSKDLVDLKNKIDVLVINYYSNKNTFYEVVYKLIEEQNIERKYFWWYLKTQLINTYFIKLKKVFYWEFVDEFISDRLLWNSLSGNLDQLEIDKFMNTASGDDFVRKLLYLRNITVELHQNMWWPFLKPLVYSLIVEHLKIDEQSFAKIQFILCFIIAKDYSEYKIIYNFFTEIKAIYGIGLGNNKLAKLQNVFDKIKISASLIILFFIAMFILFKTAPIAFFVSVLLLGILNFGEIVFGSYFHGVRWNLGLKTYLIIASMLFGFTWMINLGKSLEDSQKVFSAINSVNKITAAEVSTKENVDKVGGYVADILKGLSK